MSTSKAFFEFIFERLSVIDEVSFRPMMGEYVLYFKNKVVGGIYDNRLLVKPTISVLGLLPNAEYQLPYEGAKEMIFIKELDNKEFLLCLLETIYNDLPDKKGKK